MSSVQALISLEDAQRLVELLQQDEIEQANQWLKDKTVSESAALFDKVGNLTRQLHDSLEDFKSDSRLPELANQEIPDARDRLNYVIEMTDQAANKTMDAVDAVIPLADSLLNRIESLMPTWDGLMHRNISLTQFKEMCHQIDSMLKETVKDADSIKAKSTEILMAQEFQDLTGQLIRKVITLVQEVEDRLVEMLTLFSDDSPSAKTVVKNSEPSAATTREQAIASEGPIINKEERSDVVQDQDDVDDLLSSLGF
ncbi:protein phosphatase CheZ [Alginatibacterium sediminis]|uniref:Protein phosphatase CheZ n=1 Tax=Alginatibacterium sediminis TaxID=2164068 RepID=A0A420EFM2_9ALTE|nr:protein phosphatase CheZ [Alginatibacterium sediminis]RKF19499.1 protein phosphatase CheZ [Alginatibacterium sediminis]